MARTFCHNSRRLYSTNSGFLFADSIPYRRQIRTNPFRAFSCTYKDQGCSPYAAKSFVLRLVEDSIPVSHPILSTS